MSNPTAGTIIFGIIALMVNDNEAAIAFAIFSIGCWINKSIEELKNKE